MLSLIIHCLEVLTVALISLLLYRLFELNKQRDEKKAVETIDNLVRQTLVSKPKLVKNKDYEEKMESLKKAQMFVGAQLIEIRKEFSDIQESELEWLREAISLYLIGAVDFIGKQANCGAQSRKEIINTILKSSLKLPQDSVSDYFNEALNRQPQSDNDHMVRAGAKAAKIWLKQKQVPGDFSLRTQLDDWGVFA